MMFTLLILILQIFAQNSDDDGKNAKEKQTLNRLTGASDKVEKWLRKEDRARKRLEKFANHSKIAHLRSAKHFYSEEEDLDETNWILNDGDMIIPIDKKGKSEKEITRAELNAVKEPKRLWPKNPHTGVVKIPYMIDRGYNATSLDLMYQAMATIRRYSCIEFDSRSREADYVRIMNMTTCAAMVGHNAGRNDVFLHEPNCMSVGIIMHELLHIVGFQHEQSRSDRDDYVDVIFDNIVSTGNYRLNFNRHDTANLARYDFNSVMHYPRLSWGKKPYLQTIVPKVMPVPKVGQRVRLSPHDIEEIRSLYECSESTYQRCGEDFEATQGTFKSVNYPKQYPQEMHCNWLFTASAGNFIKVQLTDFDLAESWTCDEDSIIIHDGLNAAAPILAKICGNDIDALPEIISSTRHLYIIFSSYIKTRRGYRGFSAEYKEVSTAGPGPPPIVGDNYGDPSTNMKDDFECNFNRNANPYCGMSAAGLISDFDWRVAKGNSKNKNTGQQADSKKTTTFRNEPGESEDKYMWLDSNGKALADRARIMTPWLTPTAKCIEFAFLMYGAEKMGSLDIKAVEMDDRSETFVRVITELHGNQGKFWNSKKTSWEASIQGIRAVKFIIDGWVYSESSDIIFDDLKITQGCSAADVQLVDQWECNFDAGDKCKAQDGEVDFTWQLHAQTTPSKATGPLGDHTTGRGKYLFIEASQPRKRGDRAQLVTPPMTEDLHCLSFWYHMYGEETGSIRVRVKVGKSGRERILWEEKGEKPDKWYRAEIEVNPAFFLNDYGLVSGKQNDEVTEGDDYESDENENVDRATSLSGESATEQVFLYDDEEADYDGSGDDNDGQTSNRTRRSYDTNDVQTDTYIVGDMIFTKYDVDSMKTILDKLQDTMVRHDAVRITKKEKGLYITIEAERGFGYRGDSAIDDIKVTNIPCSTWAEWSPWAACSNSCGGGIQQRNRECFLKNKKKCNGKFGEERMCNLHNCGGWSCNFDGGLCGMTQLQGDDFDWVRKSGYTPSAMTGPTHDVSGNGYYMFIEASSPQKTNDAARLQTPKFPTDTDYCLSFHYHMWGNVTDMPQAVGQMNVIYTSKDGNQPATWKKVFGKRDDQGKSWHEAKIPINPSRSTPEFSLVFEAVRGYSYRSDIALDEIVLTNTDCDRANDAIKETVRQAQEESLDNMQLEEGMKVCTMNWRALPTCDWVQGNNGKEDQVDFTRSNDRTTSADTGPDGGTGLGTPPRGGEADYFLFLEASDVDNGQGAMLKSKPLAAIPYCVSLDYHMFGKGTGGLEIFAQEKNKDQVLTERNGYGSVDEEEELAGDADEESNAIGTRSLKRLTGDKKNTWHNLQINYRPTVDTMEVLFQIVATRGSSWASDIAIDNMLVKAGPCIEIESVEAEQFTVKWGQMTDLIAYTINISPELPNFKNGNTTLQGVTIGDLEPESSYQIELITYLTGGRIFQAMRDIKTMPVLTGFMAGFTKSTVTKLRWNHDDQFAGYDIQIIPTISSFSNGIHLGNKTEYDIAGLLPSTRYSFTVNGIGHDGFAYRSNKAKVLLGTAPDAPTLIVKPGSKSINIAWDPVGSYSWLEITPQPAGYNVRNLYDNTQPTEVTVKNLNTTTAYHIQVYGVMSLGGQIPKSLTDLMKAIQSPVSVLTDADKRVVQTAPLPPTLVISDRRADSVKVSWPDFADSDEVKFLIKLKPGNGQLYSTAATDISDKFIYVQNLQPGINYMIEVVASYELDRATDPTYAKIAVNCERNYHKIPSVAQMGPYRLDTTWSICGWYSVVNNGLFMKVQTQDGKMVMGGVKISGQDGVKMSFTFAPDIIVTIDMQPDEKLSFICATRDAAENLLSVFYNGRKISETPVDTSNDEKLIIMTMVKGPVVLIDYNIWNYKLTEKEISLQKGKECISGMESPRNPLPPNTNNRNPAQPQMRVVGKQSTTATVQLNYGELVTGVFVDLQPPSRNFRNGIQPKIMDMLQFTGLEPGEEYILQVSSILAGIPSTLGSSRFTSGSRSPAINVPSIKSTHAFMQWTPVEGAVSYSISLPNSDTDLIVSSAITQHEITNLSGGTDYNVKVKAIFDKPAYMRYIETDYGLYGFSTAAEIRNFHAPSIRSTEFTLDWVVDYKPSFYKLTVNPSLPGFDSNIQDITAPITLTGATANTDYEITLIAVFDGSESNPVTLQIKTAPFIINADVRVLRSTLMMIGWDMVPGATDLRLTIRPPIASITNGLQGTFRNYIQMMNLRPLTKYEIEISMLLGDTETDMAIIIQETAPSSSGLTVVDIRSTSVIIQWSKIENIQQYRIVISPPVEGFVGEINAGTNQLLIENLNPGTAYALYVSGILTSGIQTDTAAEKFSTVPLLSPINVDEVRSTTAALSWDEVSDVTSWNLVTNDGVTVEYMSLTEVNLLDLETSSTYNVSLTAIYNAQTTSDTIYLSFDTFAQRPRVDIRNVQSSAFNILWSNIHDAIGYRVIITPPVGDYDNGIIEGNDEHYLSIYDAEENSKYSVQVSAVFGERRETDVSESQTQTAFTMQIPTVVDITETSSLVSWSDHLHEDDHEEHEGSGISDSVVELDDYDHLEVINYRLTINPPVASFDPRSIVKNNMQLLVGLKPGTEYRVELIAVLSSGAETDLVETAFTTEGTSDTTHIDSECALSYQRIQEGPILLSSCDFEGGTLCGWSQSRLGTGKLSPYHWRIDYERSVTVNNKSKVLLAPYTKRGGSMSAELVSPRFTGITCVYLEVLMFRKNVQQFYLKVRHSDDKESVVSILNGPQGNQWIQMEQSIFLPETMEYQIVIEAKKGADWKSAISIDNLQVTSGPCWNRS